MSYGVVPLAREGVVSSCLTVLTAADPNMEVMRAFLLSLEGFSLKTGQEVVWRVVDGLKAFSPSFDVSIFESKLVHVDWVSPSCVLSHAEAITYGFSLSRGDFVLMMSPDMTSNVADIPDFVDKMDEGAAAVAGWRVKRSGVSFTRRALTKVFNGFAKVLFKLSINDVNTCMALVSPKVTSYLLEAPRDCPSPALYAAYMLRNEISEVPITVNEYPGRASTYSLSVRFKVGIGRLREIIAFFFWCIRGNNA